MGFLDELATAGLSVGRLAADEARARLREFNQASNDRRRWADIDERLAKAAKKATEENNAMVALGSEEHKPAIDPKGLLYDPFDPNSAMGYRERPTAFTYGAMEMIGRGVPVVADVIRVRTAQVQEFCKAPEDRHSPGCKVRLRDWKNQQMTPAAEKEAAALEQVLLHTGYAHPLRPQDAITLKEFAGKAIPDSLIFDQLNFEVVPDRKGGPSYLQILDPSTIRLLDMGQREPDEPYAVQVINGSIVADFTKDELAFCIRNGRSGIRSHGYGLSEIETLVREVTGFLWGMDYNRRFFTQGSATKGILNFKGTIPDKHLKAFRRQWYAMIAGVANSWKTPITNAEELQWINMQLSNRDMEYSAWMDFLIKIVCARFLIAPEEVQFSYGNTGQSQAMGQAPIEEKLKASRDLGLRPLVWWFFEQMNKHLIQRINPDFEAVPVGLEAEGFQAETELIGEQQGFFLKLDEARERMELEPVGPEKGGDLIMNPVYLQYIQGKEMQEQQDAMGMGPDDDFNETLDEEDPEAEEQNDGEAEDFTVQPQGGQDLDEEPEPALKSERDRVTYVTRVDTE